MNRPARTFGLAVALTLCPGPGPDQCRADERLKVMGPVRQLLRERRCEEALEALVRAAAREQDPENQAYYFKEASDLARGRLGDVERALALARRIADPMRSQSQQLVVLAGARRWTEVAERFADTNISGWPETWRLESYLARARMFLKRNRIAKAEQDLVRAIDAIGSVARRGRACQMLGDLYRRKMDDRERALAVFKKGLGLTPANYAWRNECFLGMIGILVEAGQHDAAAAAFATVDYRRLPSDGWRASFYIAHADVLRRLGYNGQAATCLTKALRLPEITASAKAKIEADLDRLIADMWEAGDGKAR